MRKQIGAIVPDKDMNVEYFKQTYIEQYENIDSLKQKKVKIEFVENSDEDGSHWIEVWAED